MIESPADARFFRRVDALEAGRRDESRSFGSMSFSDYLTQLQQVTFGVGGNTYTLPVMTTQQGQRQEDPDTTFASYTQGVYKADGVVFAVMAARSLLLSETCFKFRNLSDRRIFGGPGLRLLEEPWPNGTTGELLTRLEQDVSLAGNAFVLRDGNRLRRLRPDRVSLLLGSKRDEADPAAHFDVEVIGYLYRDPATPGSMQHFSTDDVAHWSPVPDPTAPYRGMSWLQPVIREVMSDQAATIHKQRFFENAATPNLAVKFPESIKTKEQFEQIRDAMDASHAGASNAWKTLYLAAGADVSVVGADMKSLDFKSIQGTYETRICNAARVPAVVAGVSEGLSGSSLNAGNFSQARRLFVDGWYRPHVRSLCAALSRVVKAPAGAELWYDDTDIGMLREDVKDAAEIAGKQASAVRQAIEAGFEPDAAVEFVMSNDPSKLMGAHTGLSSVQLQPPMDPNAPATDGGDEGQGENDSTPTGGADDE